MSIESRSRQYGVVFNHWQIKDFLGSGSGEKSAVFKLNRVDSTRGKSALKVITLIEEKGQIDALSAYRRSEYEQAKQECRRSAEQEVWLMDALHGNTNIVDYLDHTFVDWSDANSFGCDMLIRMELLEDLRGKLRNGQLFSEKEILKIGRDICTALMLCHGKDILHRDIKPENIFINADGNYKLGDFGVSRILSAAPTAMASTGIGTPEYAAPEQFTGRHDRLVDIYSLGLVLYELSNGNRLPFASTSYVRQEDVMRRQMGEPLPAPCNASKSLSRVILKACAYKKEDRFQSAQELLTALNHVSGAAAAPDYRTQKAVSAYGGNVTQRALADDFGRAESNATVRAAESNAPVRVNAAAQNSLHKSAPKGKKSTALAKAAVAVAAVLLAGLAVTTLFFKHTHTWTEAACTKPKTCSQCGETEGAALGHQWLDATCSAPKTCSECGETKGTALGHQWLDATCSAPQICNVCGETAGTESHQWIAATYQAPQTCSLCGTTKGSHLVADPVYINELDHYDKYGKLWTMSEHAPDHFAHTNISSDEAYLDMSTPGHTTGPVYDYLGNRYTYGLTIDGAEYAEYYVSYDLDGMYSRFTGSYSMSPDMDGTSFADRFSKFFEVYGDGVLLFQSAKITQGSALQEFNIDVSDVEILTIVYPLEYRQASGPSRIATIFDGMLS